MSVSTQPRPWAPDCSSHTMMTALTCGLCDSTAHTHPNHSVILVHTYVHTCLCVPVVRCGCVLTYIRTYVFSLSSLHRHLDQEESAYAEAKAVVDKHRQRLAERKQALRRAEQELARDLRKVSKELKDTHQMALVDGIQASLKEVSMGGVGDGAVNTVSS